MDLAQVCCLAKHIYVLTHLTDSTVIQLLKLLVLFKYSLRAGSYCYEILHDQLPGHMSTLTFNHSMSSRLAKYSPVIQHCLALVSEFPYIVSSSESRDLPWPF